MGVKLMKLTLNAPSFLHTGGGGEVPSVKLDPDVLER